MFHETWRMEKMFKKTLIASALFAAAFNASAAVTVTLTENTTTAIPVDATTGAQLVSVEGLPTSGRFDIAAAADGVSSGDLTINTAIGASEIATLSDSDNVVKIKVTIAGGFLSATPTTANVVVTDATPAAADTVAADADAVTPAIAAGATSTSFIVTLTKSAAVTDGAFTDNSWAAVFADEGTIQFINLPVIFTNKTKGSSVSVTTELLTSTNVSLGKSAAKNLATLTNQFAVSTIASTGTLNAKVDVSQDRLYFANATKATDDVLGLKFVTTGSGATANDVTVTILGDFSGVEEVVDDSANEYVINALGTEASFEFDGTTTPSVTTILADAAYEVTLTVDGATTLAERTFQYTADLSFDDAESVKRSVKLADKASAGAWSLNGDGAYISFLPFGSAFSQSVTITNTSTVDGEVSVDWYYKGAVVPTKLTTLAKGRAVTDISSELRALAAANGVVGNAALDIVVNAPDGKVSIDALYYSKADKDRGVMASDK
jgi:hypothetical protein